MCYIPFNPSPAPCPTCGHCPTCGRNAAPAVPMYPVQPSPWWQWQTNGNTGTLTFDGTKTFTSGFITPDTSSV